jgi:endonuclease/exonuclease/phosphatase family metal-dependent hydrolase
MRGKGEVPASTADDRAPSRNNTLLFASYNVHKCVGIDRRFDPDRVRQVIAEIDPDVIALQEADKRFGDRMGLIDLAALRRETGLEPIPLARRRRLGHGHHGNLLLVRHGKVRDVRQIDLPGLEPRGAVVADLELRDGVVRVMAAHLGLLRQSRLAQVRAILAALPHERDEPTVLLGDMNEWRKDHRSALGSLAPGFGPVGAFVPSFPAVFPVFALDRILARPHQLIEHIEAHVSDLSRVASDHLPVKARVRLDVAAAAHEEMGETPREALKLFEPVARRARLRLRPAAQAIGRRLRVGRL